MVHFLRCVVDDLNLIDLVLTGLDLPVSDCGMSVGRCLRVYFEISCDDNLTNRISKGNMFTIDFLPALLPELVRGTVFGSLPCLACVELSEALVVPVIT